MKLITVLATLFLGTTSAAQSFESVPPAYHPLVEQVTKEISNGIGDLCGEVRICGGVSETASTTDPSRKAFNACIQSTFEKPRCLAAIVFGTGHHGNHRASAIVGGDAFFVVYTFSDLDGKASVERTLCSGATFALDKATDRFNLTCTWRF